jgi:phosphoribosyl 1,2-cyclic phosphodiesterase
MKLIVVGTGSKGNGYVLQDSKGECLLIEAGMKLIEVKQVLNFNIQNIQGMLVSHEHL